MKKTRTTLPKTGLSLGVHLNSPPIQFAAGLNSPPVSIRRRLNSPPSQFAARIETFVENIFQQVVAEFNFVQFSVFVLMKKTALSMLLSEKLT